MFLNSACRLVKIISPAVLVVLIQGLLPGIGFSQTPAPLIPLKPWKPLLDNRVDLHWTGFKKPSFPEKGWSMVEGALKHAKNGGGGDIVSKEQFSDFELEWEWVIGPGGNSGIKYFIIDERGGAIGHEYQMLDDYGQKEKGRIGKGSTGSFYDVLPPVDPPLKPAGQTNYSRILVQGHYVEHWLNGRRILQYELNSPEVKSAVAKSKFKEVAGFGAKTKGRILLQDHGGEVWFRNIRIRELGAPLVESSR